MNFTDVFVRRMVGNFRQRESVEFEPPGHFHAVSVREAGIARHPIAGRDEADGNQRRGETTHGFFHSGALELFDPRRTKMTLNPASPHFVRRHVGAAGQVFQGLVREPGRVGGRESAEDFGRKARVLGAVAGALPGLGGEGRALGQLGLKAARSVPQIGE